MTTWREVKTSLVQPPSARRQHVRADEYARLCSIIIIIITIVVIFHITVAVISDISRLRKNDKPSFGRCYPWLHPLSSCMSSVTSDMLIVFTYLLTYLLADRAHRLCDRDGRSVDHVQSSAARRELSMLHALASRPVSTCINCNDVAARDLRSSSHTARMSTSSNTVVAPSAAGHFPPRILPLQHIPSLYHYLNAKNLLTLFLTLTWTLPLTWYHYYFTFTQWYGVECPMGMSSPMGMSHEAVPGKCPDLASKMPW